MKARLFAVFALVIGLALLLAWNVAAQGPEPPGHQPPAHPQGAGGANFGPAQTGGAAAQDLGAAVALGQPGTVYRYVHTFGETEVPYTSDSTHLNRPYSLAVDKANNVYVGEVEGERVLKFNSGGVFQAQIGRTGLCYVTDEADSGTCDPHGLGVGPNGDLWIAEGTNRVSVFTHTANIYTYASRLGRTWESGDDNDHFNQPEGVAFDSAGRIYVADRDNHRVQVFDSTGTYSATLGNGTCGTGNDEFCEPHGLAVGSGDVLYVADNGNHRVQVFRLVADSMVFSQSITTTGTTDFGWVPAVAVDANYLYVVDDDNDQVHVFNRSGVYSSSIAGDCGGSNDWFCWPMDVAVDGGGNVYVPSTWEDFRLMKCSGGPAWTCDTFAGTQEVPYVTDNYHYFDPQGLAVDGAGAIFLTEGSGRRLIKLNSSGTPQWTVGEPGVWSQENDRFGSPVQAAVDSSGRVYVADADHHRVQIYAGDGSYDATLGNEDCNPSNGLTAKEFCAPRGVAVGGNGRIYVADTNNHRVQVFDSNRNYLATLGTSGESGDDANHFNWPRGVTVDSSNNVYVADSNNNRVQKCTVVGSGGACSTFAGVTGEWGDNHDRLGNPQDIAVSGGKVFVAECGPDRVQVFDTSGAYLTTIGNSWGDRTGELRCPAGIDVDSSGNVYVTDRDNARIQKYAPGVPGWKQVNINGFGDRRNESIGLGAPGDNYLYAGTSNQATGGQLWRTANGTAWTQVYTDGFGSADNTGIGAPKMFGSYLYLGTENSTSGAEVWRSNNGLTWTQCAGAGFEDADNTAIDGLIAFQGYLYVSTHNGVNGSEIWRTNNGTTWTQVDVGGFGDSDNADAYALRVFSNTLYIGFQNDDTGAELWQSSNGTTWGQVSSNGFGDPYNQWPRMAEYSGFLYLGFANDSTDTHTGTGTQIWRSANGSMWDQVVGNGFGNPDNGGSDTLVAFGGDLYSGVYNTTHGTEVWRTQNGTTWSLIAPPGFGDSNNYSMYGSAVFNQRLFLAAPNWANGGEIWSTGSGQVYLPAVLKNQ